MSEEITQLLDKYKDDKNVLMIQFIKGGLLKNKCQMSICIDNVLEQNVFVEKIHFPSSQYKQTYKYCLEWMKNNFINIREEKVDGAYIILNQKMVIQETLRTHLKELLLIYIVDILRLKVVGFVIGLKDL